MSKVLNGIDVSKHQSVIDWDKVKPCIDFAILRCGYGSDITSQDDAQFEKNATECERLNIPYGVYLYSYAKNENMIDSEVAHALRVIGNHKPFCVYIDMEENATAGIGKTILTAFAKRFCEAVKAKGFKVGVYANQNWFTNYLDVAALHNAGYSIWCAKYSDNKPNIAAPYDIWQYTSSGSVDGVNGNVDMNFMYNDIRNVAPAPSKPDVTYQVWDDVKNNWLPNVKNDSDYAGLFGHDVCAVLANLSKGNIFYKVHYKGGKWLPEVKNREDYAGLFNKPIDGLMMRTDTGAKIYYRVHIRCSNKWLPWVTGYSESDDNNGYAGIIGQEIDAIQIKF